MKRAALLAVMVSLAGCGDGMIDDAAWSFRWRTADGRESVDRWTNQNVTCKQSAADEWNLRALLHQSKLATCSARCRDHSGEPRIACRLGCDAAIELAEKSCQQRKRKRPPRSWLDLH